MPFIDADTELTSLKTSISSLQEAGTPMPRAVAYRPSVDEVEAVAEPPQKAETDLPRAYLNYLDEMQKAWGDLPDLTITYHDLSYVVRVPAPRSDIPNLYTAFHEGMRGLNPFRDTSKETVTFKPLQDASGIIRPGELTLVLAPPGHGKSVLLKALAGRLQRESENLQGQIRWNGLNAAQSAESGQQLSKLCAFVEQGDVHYPMLTVRETFQFALDNSNADTKLLGSPEFTALQEKKVDLMLELLGLKECADTVVGNTMLRGVSGGQKKRVTLGEMMITQARALFLDEISTGLDAAATFDIVSALKKWTRVMRGSATVALLQPAPEVFEMFDNIILLREGVVVFSGSVPQLRQHFTDIRIKPNPHIDFADWLVEFLTDPPAIWKRDMQSLAHHSSQAGVGGKHEAAPILPLPNQVNDVEPIQSIPGQISPPASPSRKAQQLSARTASTPQITPHATNEIKPINLPRYTADAPEGGNTVPMQTRTGVATVASPPKNTPRPKGLGQLVLSTGIPLTTAALKKAYESSRTFQDSQTELRDIAYTMEKKYLALGVDRSNLSPFTRAQFYQAQSWSVWHHTKACLHRQWLFMSRSPTFIIPRLGQAVAMGLIMGSVYYQLASTEFSSRMGLMLFSLIFVSFANMAEIPLASQFKLVVYKQVDAGFYSTFSYVFSVILMHFPLAITECFVFGTCLYWMTDFVSDAGHYFFFLLLLFGNNLLVASMFRLIAYTCSSADVAFNLSGPSTALCSLFGGFLITREKIPNWLIEFYYLSPFSWGLRSAALSEFKSNRYATAYGDAYLETWQISTNAQYKWAGVGYQWAIFLLFVVLGAAALKFKRLWLTSGTRRTDTVEEEDSIEVRIGAKTSSMVAAAQKQQQAEDANQLAFTQMDLTFIDLKYTVTVKEKNDDTGKYETRQRKLLTGINGYARAGELTALMGSSGAGKTTLMDVIAGRKTAGTIEGQILINGHPQKFPDFNRLMGYCEQVDVHIGTDTVREAIAFSARLRLPSDVNEEARNKFVDQILDDLELTPIANRLIGDANIAGLSPGQLKRVTIGVELAANPAFLFLDEPTSGLDSRAALIVCRVIRKIARRGRSVVCTIHQPSAELFCMFDRLLFLKSGGKEVYFGPVGEEGIDVVEYFMNAKIGPEFYRPKLPENVNPASWMLDVIGAGTSAKGQIAEYNSVYVASPLREQNMSTVKLLSTPKAGQASFDSLYATSWQVQLYQVLYRLFTVYWRDIGYNFTKLSLMIFIGFLFGLLYRDIGDHDDAGLTSKLSVMFSATGFLGILQSSNVLPVAFRLREVFYRERAANVYAPWVYATSQATVELPYLFVGACLFTLPFYFLVHFESDASLFFKYLLVLYLEAIFFAWLGLFFSAVMPNIHVAHIFMGLTFTFYFLFGGVFIQKSSIPTGWQFMYYLNPISKGFVSLVIQQYSKYDCVIGTAGCDYFISSTLGQPVTKWEFAMEYVASGHGWEKNYLGWLVLSIGVIAIGFFLAVQKVSHVKR